MSLQDHLRKNGSIAVPGDILGVIEEFEPGFGTYVEENTIYSLATGRALIDLQNKKVSVYPQTQKSGIPKKGSIIIGQVSEIQNKQAIVRIFNVDNRMLNGFFSGILHISDVSPRYIENMYDVCKAGDIIRATVISDKNRVFHLSTNEKDLGVIYAFCSRCGNVLSLGRMRMRCNECSNLEHRKTAHDYMKGEFKE